VKKERIMANMKKRRAGAKGGKMSHGKSRGRSRSRSSVQGGMSRRIIDEGDING
jgi:hypothetical protein